MGEGRGEGNQGRGKYKVRILGRFSDLIITQESCVMIKKSLKSILSEYPTKLCWLMHPLMDGFLSAKCYYEHRKFHQEDFLQY